MSFLDKIQNGVYIIAEMSANHAGSLECALEIVRAAKDSGADCIKIQTYTADTMTIDCDNEYFKISGGLWDGYKLYDLYKEAYTPWQWHEAIKNEAEKVGLDFLSTPFDDTSTDFLEALGVEAYKVASFELVDIPLIKHIAKKGKSMIVSCGMGSIDEIHDAVDAMTGEGLSKEQIVLLKCTSEYPADPSDMNLLTIPDMKSRFGVRVGFSDHSMGSLAAVVAVSLGACIVEKHFCLDRSIKNPDSEFSMEPYEFSEMVKDVRKTEIIRGSISYELSEKESASTAFRRSVFVAKGIAYGEEFTKENLRIIRPGYGLAPKLFDSVLGKTADRDLLNGTPLREEYIHNGSRTL